MTDPAYILKDRPHIPIAAQQVALEDFLKENLAKDLSDRLNHHKQHHVSCAQEE